MPGIVIFGRRWDAASDDLVIPGIMELFVRITWLIAVVSICIHHGDPLSCSGAVYLNVYLGGEILSLSAIIVVTLLLVKSSMKGTIMDTEARKSVSLLIYIRVGLTIPEIVLNILGSWWAFTPGITCENEEIQTTVTAVRGLAICSWILTVAIFTGVAFVFDWLGTYAAYERDILFRRHYLDGSQPLSNSARIWELRCSLLCCSCCRPASKSSSVNTVFEDVAGVFAMLFQDVDVVPSDILAGFLLLHFRHKVKRERQKGMRIRESPSCSERLSSPVTDQPSINRVEGDMRLANIETFWEPSYEGDRWMNPISAYYFMKYALASYGWPWYLYGGFLSGIYEIQKTMMCCGCIRGNVPPYIVDDNCCYCNLAALKTITELEDDDLVHVSFHNGIYEVPYYIAVDHRTKSVIIAIRGTLSLHDALTDLAAVHDALNIRGMDPSWKAHKGMLHAALYVKSSIDKTGALNRAFASHQSYKLIVTGHSLGAGAAVILSLFLKHRYPDLRCFAFSPPGGLLSLEAAKYTESFCLSVIVGDDVVPRLSVGTLELLKKQLMTEIQTCSHPKYRILVKGCWYTVFGVSPLSRSPDSSELLTHPLLSHSDSDLNPGGYSSVARNYGGSHVVDNGCESSSREVVLFLPGKILQIDAVPNTESGQVSYQTRWSSREEYDQILVSPGMLRDHVPDSVSRTLQGLAFQIDGNFVSVVTV